jgi:hypothetical protein
MSKDLALPDRPNLIARVPCPLCAAGDAELLKGVQGRYPYLHCDECACMIQVRSRRGANALHALADKAPPKPDPTPAPTPEPKPALAPDIKPRSRGALDVLLGD